MISKFLSRNGEIYRVLLENEDTYWLISFDDPTRCPFCVSAAEMDDFQHVLAPQDFEIELIQWPSRGLPHEIITDKGTEFFGPRMQELCQRFGVEIQSLPPSKSDGKGLVEKSFDLIQQRYKPLLRGKGVIEPDQMLRSVGQPAIVHKVSLLWMNLHGL